MLDIICISINNRCNLNCKYCHFHEKKDFIQKSSMDVLKILDNTVQTSLKLVTQRGRTNTA